MCVTFRDSAMVQLSVLLCLIPLALENAMMQAHITQACLPLIMVALDRHRDEVDIQTKGLVLLGVLIQVGWVYGAVVPVSWGIWHQMYMVAVAFRNQLQDIQ